MIFSSFFQFSDLFWAAIGLLFGWYISHLQTLHRDKTENTERFAQIKVQFQFNLDRMHDILKAFDSYSPSPEWLFPDFTLDLTVLDFLLAHGSKSFSSLPCGCGPEEPFRKYNWHRYQMHHINNKLRILFPIVHQPYGLIYLKSTANHIRGEMHAINMLFRET
jgi:hypothetical protein